MFQASELDFQADLRFECYGDKTYLTGQIVNVGGKDISSFVLTLQSDSPLTVHLGSAAVERALIIAEEVDFMPSLNVDMYDAVLEAVSVDGSRKTLNVKVKNAVAAAATVAFSVDAAYIIKQVDGTATFTIVISNTGWIPITSCEALLFHNKGYVTVDIGALAVGETKNVNATVNAAVAADMVPGCLYSVEIKAASNGKTTSKTLQVLCT
ncbi:MAG: hypothetical protein NWF09_09625 [Candidatus Bathyarchaeota archaeon]|nr:hypothetical protein [Candidatus Bathyarchaeota archaeon]